MAQNLNYGTRVDDSVPQRNDAVQEKYCYGDLESNCTTYGALYQWQEAMQMPGGCVSPYSLPEKFSLSHCDSAFYTLPGHQGLCPVGWHIPNATEFNTLLATIAADGYASNNGQVLRATSFASGLDLYKFSALGAGDVVGNDTPGGGGGNVAYLNSVTWLWASSLDTNGTYLAKALRLPGSQITADTTWEDNPQIGYSVRCLRDN